MPPTRAGRTVQWVVTPFRLRTFHYLGRAQTVTPACLTGEDGTRSAQKAQAREVWDSAGGAERPRLLLSGSWRTALSCGFHTHQAPRLGAGTSNRTNGGLPISQPDRAIPTRGRGTQGRLAQHGAGGTARMSAELRARLAGRVRALLRARVLPAPGSGPAARAGSGPARGQAPWARTVGGGVSGALRQARDWRPRPASVRLSFRGSPRDQLAQPTGKRTFPGRDGRVGRSLGRGPAEAARRAGSETGRGRRGAGAERAGPGGGGPGVALRREGRGGGLESRRGLLGQRSYWGRDREGAWFYGQAWRGAEPAAGGVSARDWSPQLQVIWSLELGLPDGPRDSPAAASEAPFWPQRVCVELTPPAQPCLESGRAAPR